MLDASERVAPWYRHAGALSVVGALVLIGIVDLVVPALGIRTFLLVPVVASIVFGRPAWTAWFSGLAGLVGLIVWVVAPSDPVLFWRRVAVLAFTCGLSVFLARLVGQARLKLAEDSRQFRLLAENSTDVVFRGDNVGVLQWISAQAQDIIGWAPAEMVGRPFREFVHPDDVPDLVQGQQELLQGVPTSMRIRLVAKDGRHQWVAITAHPVFDDDGAVSGRVGGWTDIQDVVLAREDAQAKGSQIRAMLDSQLDPFVHFTSIRDESGRVVDLRFTEANAAAFAYNRSSPEEMLGHTFLEFYPGLMDHGPMADYIACAETGKPVILDNYQYPNEILDDERRYDIRAVHVEDGIVLTWRDVTDRQRAVEALADSERRYRLLAENATDVIWQIGPDGRVEWASESSEPVLGWAMADLVGTPAMDYIHADDRQDATRARERAMEGSELYEEFRVRRADGTHVWMSFTVRGIVTPEGVTRIVTLRNVDAEVVARQRLAEIVGRDPLTGLMTREVMEGRIADALAAAGGGRVAVLCVGVDTLSAVNEAYTHAVGDVVIATTAARIAAEVGEPDNVARGAGVDFIVLVPEESGAADASSLATRIRHAAREEVVVGVHHIRPTVSIGIATGQMTGDAGHLVRAATLAMRSAKDAGRDRVAFATPELAAEAEHRLNLATTITRALASEEFTAWFQPITDLVTGQVRGYEALARWITPQGAVVEPAGFMPVLEASPLISRVDSIALETSLVTLSSLPAPLFVSVNVSARSLSMEEFSDHVLSAVHGSGIDPAWLHLEVTETALLDVSRDVIGRMQRIADAGIHWYIDDFGTGYSAISHLRDLPVTGLKLDLSFTAGIGRGETRSIRLAQALAGMAQGLGLDTVAEGIETEEEAAILSAQGWRHGQGWLYGKAAPIST